MNKLDKITKKHFQRIIEIAANPDNEFCDLNDRMSAISSRSEIWRNEMADALHEDD